MPRSRATVSHWRSMTRATCCGVLSGSASASILLRATKRASAGPPRWSRQIARSDLVTPVSAPRMNTVAWADGSRPRVSSGSVPIAFRPGVSSTTRPRLSSGCGRLMRAWRQAGTSTRPCASSGGLSSGRSSSQKPSALASSSVTTRVRITSCSACAISSGRDRSISMRVHQRGWWRSSVSEAASSRVSIGSSTRPTGSSASKPSSTGHMVVRPGVAGSMRRPVSAKKMALISSDLPRENSATKATISFSPASRARMASNQPACASSSRSSSRTSRARRARRPSSAVRQALSSSSCRAKVGLAECCVMAWMLPLGKGRKGRIRHPIPGHLLGSRAAGRVTARLPCGGTARAACRFRPPRPPAACRLAGRLQRRWHTGQKKVERCPCTMRRTGVPQDRQGWPSRP